MRLTNLLRPALLLVGGAAMAQDKIESDFKVVQACTSDVATLCACVTPGEGRIRDFVKDNMAKLSPGCVDACLTAMAVER